MSEHLDENDRDMLDILHRVCWMCADVSPDMQSWELQQKYRQARDALEKALLGLLRTKLEREKQ